MDTGTIANRQLLSTRPIRITIPAEVAFDLNKFRGALQNLAERLGHPGCLSGADCRFGLHRDFVVDPATLGVRGVVIVDG